MPGPPKMSRSLIGDDIEKEFQGDWNKLNREEGKASPRTYYRAGPWVTGPLPPRDPLRSHMGYTVSQNCLPCTQLVVIAVAKVKA